MDISEDSITAWARLLKTSQRLLGDVEQDLKAAGFPPLAWYDALLELKRAGPAGLRPFQLQDRMLLAQYNLSRLVDRLVKAGYVEKGPSNEDGRGHLLHITPEGRALQLRMWPHYRDAISTHFASQLDPWDTSELGRILGALRHRSSNLTGD